MTAEAKKECDRELKRLSKMTPASAEYMVSRTYLEWMASLPWSKSSGSSEIDIRGRTRFSTKIITICRR